MPEDEGTLAALGELLARLLRPLEEGIEGDDLRRTLTEVGLTLPPTVDADAALSSAGRAALQRVQGLEPILDDLAAAVAAEDVGAIVTAAVRLVDTVVRTVDDLGTVANAVKNLAGTGIPQPELDQFAADLPGRLVEYLAVRNLEGLPGAAQAGQFIGAIERVEMPAVDAAHPAFVKRALHIDQLTAFLSDPAAQLKARYLWGAPAFDGVALLQTLSSLLAQAGVPAVLDTNGPVPLLDVVAVEVSPKLDDPKGLRITLVRGLDVDRSAPFVQDDWQVTVTLDTSLDVGVEVVLTTDDGITIKPVGSNQAQGDVRVEWVGGTLDGEPYTILGEPGGSRLQAQQLILRAGAGLAWDPVAGLGQGTLTVGGEVRRGKLVVSLANADGFLGSVLGGFGLESDFDLGVGYSTREGVFFAGSATLDIQLPLHVELGPVELTALTVTVGLAGSTFPVGLRADVKAALGPLVGVIEQVGIGADLAIRDDLAGNAGPLDFTLRFLPPKGVGLSLDVGVVKGGGYLFIDAERGEYAGALELALFDVVTIQAIGIITTRMPDGSSGFSLLIIMSVQFGAGVQLGFGFTLSAVGGLVGLNRTMDLQALAEGIRSGAIESVMFPDDIIANAPRIISDLRRFFPPRQDTFLVGPMVKIAWGTPTLASISLGVIVEIPGSIAIVGSLKVALPADDVALIVLQVNFIGAIEPDKKRIWFFASLFESRIVFLTIDGEMGLLIAFGDDANFVLSVGGFHPRFSPPPLPFPSPRRVAVSLLSTPLSRMNVEAYFAVTSNTVQFGARVELFFGLNILNVQGHLGFDALFQFSPFFFVFEISASLSVKVFGIGLFSVGIRGSLDGPSPWHVKGHGSIGLLFWDIDVDFEDTWGEVRGTDMPPIAVLPIVTGELAKPECWTARLPVGANLLVSLRAMPEAEAVLMLHPVGVLHVSQRVVPLGIKLDKIGARKPNDVEKVTLDITPGSGLTRSGDAFEQFAPAQFQNFSDADKLSKPAFTPERSGLDLSAGGADTRSSRLVRRIVRYEEIIIDSNYQRFARRFVGFIGVLFDFFLARNAAARCELSQAAKVALLPFPDAIEVQAETYTVAHQADNTAYDAGAAVFHSQASAEAFLGEQVAADPNLAATLHVIPTFEMAAA